VITKRRTKQSILDDYNEALKQGKGERNSNAKLTEAQVTEIRDLYYHGGLTQAQIGEMYGCSQRNISYIISYQNWNSNLNIKENVRRSQA
jgi:DNA-binding transcriptional regulator LsrR (DeoR family)